jgi:hypothetical protein
MVFPLLKKPVMICISPLSSKLKKYFEKKGKDRYYFSGRYFFCLKYSMIEKIKEGRNKAICMLKNTTAITEKKNMPPK